MKWCYASVKIENFLNMIWWRINMEEVEKWYWVIFFKVLFFEKYFCNMEVSLVRWKGTTCTGKKIKISLHIQKWTSLYFEKKDPPPLLCAAWSYFCKVLFFEKYFCNIDVSLVRWKGTTCIGKKLKISLYTQKWNSLYSEGKKILSHCCASHGVF